MYKEEFHNTIGYSGERKDKAEKKSISQSWIIYDFMTQNPMIPFTPFDIQKNALPNSPITSVRRSLTNMTKKGMIVKTNDKKMEKFGEENYLWMYVPDKQKECVQLSIFPENKKD